MKHVCSGRIPEMLVSRFARLVIVSLSLCVLTVTKLSAQPGIAPPLGSDLALRQSFSDSGVTFNNNLTQFYLGNTSGGLDREFRYGGHGDYVTNVDFGKLGIQEGFFLKARAEHRFGESLAGATGTLLPPDLIADLPVSDSREVYITNLLFTQAFSENFAIFAGKLDTLDGDQNAFASGRGFGQFSNGAFVADPIALRSIPYSTLGTGFVVLSDGEPILNFLVINPTDTTRTIGIKELFNEGVALSSELRVPTRLLGKPGHQLIGGTWNNRSYTSLGQDPRIILPNVPVAKQTGSWSLYWNCDQYLVVDPQNAKRGWGYFARAGIADNATNPISYFLSSGLGGNSPINSRTRDNFGIGYYFSGTSSQVGPFINAAFGPVGNGQGVELFYNVVTAKGLTITPDLQVLSPFRSTVDTSLVAGIRANIRF